MAKQKVLVIAGPTASGKTKTGVEVAKRLNGEIISADSMQIYRGMDIGTAKPTADEMQRIPHYMIDIADIGENFNVAKYKEMATEIVENIVERNKLPIIVGGTGLYINSIIDEINYDDASHSQKIRVELEEEVSENGLEALYEKLKEIDCKAAERISPNDTKRIIRALEVYKATGKTITEFQENSKEKNKKYDYIVIGLTANRSTLYSRINSRVDEMIKNGLEEEVRSIIFKADKTGTSFQAIGYKEWRRYFTGEISFNETIEKIKQESRRYAKRQLTWFRKNEDIIWVDTENEDAVQVIIDKYMGT